MPIRGPALIGSDHTRRRPIPGAGPAPFTQPSRDARTSRKEPLYGAIMSPATVTEARLQLEPVTADPFIADLDRDAEADKAGLASLASRVAAAPRRRIYD
jgi:hypothetical protein